MLLGLVNARLLSSGPLLEVLSVFLCDISCTGFRDGWKHPCTRVVKPCGREIGGRRLRWSGVISIPDEMISTTQCADGNTRRDGGLVGVNRKRCLSVAVL